MSARIGKENVGVKVAGRFLLMIGALFCAPQALSAAPPTSVPSKAAPAAPASYAALMVRLKAGEHVNMGELREAYAREKDYTGYFGIDTKAATEALKAGENDKVLRLVDEALSESFVDIDAHFLAAAAHRAAGRTEQADAERAIGGALLDAIFATGDGKSAQTAFRVLSVGEEYIVLSVLELRLKQQHLRTDGGVFDVMNVTDPATGKAFEIWFDISAFFGKGF